MSVHSKYFEKIRVRPQAQAGVRADGPVCQWDGCTEAGTHKAPVGRMKEGEYFRFCFDHVREYNKGYNYFTGLADTDIARFQKEALTGHRPTWKMGTSGGAAQTRASADFASRRAANARRYRDPFNLFGEGAGQPARPQRKVRPLEAKALETLGLAENATGPEIKARYKELVKRHHPDANGGDRGSEERFRDVLQAYRVLKQAGLC
ncbi:MAG: molecular chaperone DnaJ [Mesorhizobium amorphae]|nr:MAG: molecular chaperone DnaJ [Mesorhizobium amorphae]